MIITRKEVEEQKIVFLSLQLEELEESDKNFKEIIEKKEILIKHVLIQEARTINQTIDKVNQNRFN